MALLTDTVEVGGQMIWGPVRVIQEHLFFLEPESVVRKRGVVNRPQMVGGGWRQSALSMQMAASLCRQLQQMSLFCRLKLVLLSSLIPMSSKCQLSKNR